MGKLAELFRQNLASALGGAWGSKTAFVEKARLARPTLDRWLKGERVPDLDQLELVANVLGVEPSALLLDPEDQPWAHVPKELLLALSEVHPDHYPIVVNFLRSFRPEDADSELPKGLEKPSRSSKKGSKKNTD